MTSSTPVLFDAPGPRARRVNLVVSIGSAILLAGFVAYVVFKFAEAGQFAADKWAPFTYAAIQGVLLRGLLATLQVAAVATILAVIVGVTFALLRISRRRWISVPAAVAVETFRGIPVLLMIFGVFYIGASWGVDPFWAVVVGLTLYNGMVIAEIVRAGIAAVPAGQREAAVAIGLRPAQVMSIVLMPQALRMMMPSIVAQVVVLLKDSALGYLVTYQDLLYEVNSIGRSFGNLLPAFLVGAAIYILINLTVAGFARFLERRLGRNVR